jgi:hypothetical protein
VSPACRRVTRSRGRWARDAVAGFAEDIPFEVDAFVEDDPADVLIRMPEHLDSLQALLEEAGGPVPG